MWISSFPSRAAVWRRDRREDGSPREKAQKVFDGIASMKVKTEKTSKNFKVLMEQRRGNE